jgi:hypothetical protein
MAAWVSGPAADPTRRGKEERGGGQGFRAIQIHVSEAVAWITKEHADVRGPVFREHGFGIETL